MSNLEIVKVNDKWVTDSRQVADMIGKSHNHLMRDIRGYCSVLAESKIGFSEFFVESTYVDSTGRKLPCSLLTKQGCEFVANKLTGVKGTLFTAEYVTKFNEMEKQVVVPLTMEQMMLHQLQSTIELRGTVESLDKDVKQLQQLILTPITKHPQTQVNWYDLVSDGFNKLLNSGEYYLEGLGGHIGIGNLDSRRLGYVRVGPVGDKIYVQGSVLRSELSSLGIVLPSTNAVLVQCDLAIPSIKGITHVIKFNGESLRVLQLNVAI